MITLSCTWDSSPLHPTPTPAATFRAGLLTREKFAEEITLSVNYFYSRNEGSHLTLHIVRILLLGNSFLLEAWSVSLLLTLQGGLSGSVLGAQFEDLLANVCLRLCLEMAPSAKTTAPKGSSWCFSSTCRRLERLSGTTPVNVYPSSDFLLLLI